MQGRRYEWGVGLLLLAAAGALVWMATQIGTLQGFEERTTVTVRFQDAAGLSKGAYVTVAGVEVGSVQSMVIEHDLARVELAVNANAQVRSDALARIRSRSVLGEKYVELLPQAKDTPLVVDGDELVVASEQTEIDEMVEMMAPVVGAIDPELIAELVRIVGDSIKNDPQRMDRILSNMDVLLVNLADASSEMKPLIKDVQATLERADTTFDGIDSMTATVHRVAEPAPQVLLQLEDLLTRVEGWGPEVETVLGNLSELDRWELRRLLREEGVLIRFQEKSVKEPGKKLLRAQSGSK